MTWEDAVVRVRESPDMARLARDAYLDDPPLEALRRFCQSPEWSEMRRWLGTRRGLVLEIGAGRGVTSVALALDGWDVIALEPDPSAIVGSVAIVQLAREAGVRVRVVRGWGERLPFGDNIVDLVLARQALHHAKDLRTLCSEMSRVLKRGGLFLATRDHVVSSPRQLEKFLAAHPLQALYGGEHAYSLRIYRDAIRSAGIDLQRVFNPYESDVNCAPLTTHALAERLGARLGLHAAPFWLVRLTGAVATHPGRLFSFLGTKR